jgi:hypothetical protein
MALRGHPRVMKGLRLTAGWLLFKITNTKRNGRLKSGGNHPVRKVVWPA